jgi:hypothetical protein
VTGKTGTHPEGTRPVLRLFDNRLAVSSLVLPFAVVVSLGTARADAAGFRPDARWSGAQVGQPRAGAFRPVERRSSHGAVRQDATFRGQASPFEISPPVPRQGYAAQPAYPEWESSGYAPRRSHGQFRPAPSAAEPEVTWTPDSYLGRYGRKDPFRPVTPRAATRAVDNSSGTMAYEQMPALPYGDRSAPPSGYLFTSEPVW